MKILPISVIISMMLGVTPVEEPTEIPTEKYEISAYTGHEITHTGTVEIEGFGTLEFELYGNDAPKTVENFTKLVNEDFYNGLSFHRVVEGFVLQGGDPTATGAGGSDEAIFGEFTNNGFTNEIKHTRGVMSMARTYMPNSATSQFFIMHADAEYLDGSYASFGYITIGMEIIDKIASVEVDESDKPLQDIIIKTIKIN